MKPNNIQSEKFDTELSSIMDSVLHIVDSDESHADYCKIIVTSLMRIVNSREAPLMDLNEYLNHVLDMTEGVNGDELSWHKGQAELFRSNVVDYVLQNRAE